MANFSPTKFTFGETITRKRAADATLAESKRQAQAKAFVDDLNKGRDETAKVLETLTALTVEEVANGASPEQIEPNRKAFQQINDSFMGRIAQLQAMAVQSGRDPELLDQLMQFGDQQTALFDEAVSAASLKTASLTGAREGEQKVAEAEGILGASDQPQEQLTGGQAQVLAGVAPKTPFIEITQTGEQALVKELGKLDAQRINDLETAAQTAISTKREVARMRAAIESGRFKTGVFSDVRQFMARLFDFAGIDPSEVDPLIGDAATADTLDAAAARLGVDLAQKLGRITNMSLQFVKDSLPSLTRTPEGNKILIEVMDKVADRDIEIASLADSYFSQFGTLRPKDRKSFFEATRDLDESDPVIDEALRQRIIDGSKNSPKSFKDVKGFLDSITSESIELPAGIPEGSKIIGTTVDGKDVWETTDTPPRRLVVE